MAVFTEAAMRYLETCIGQAYNALQAGIGNNVDNSNSALQAINAAKCYIRGGADRQFGVKTATGLRVLPNKDTPQRTVFILPGTAYFGGIAKSVTATITVNIPVEDMFGVGITEILDEAAIPVTITLKDTQSNPTYGLYRGMIHMLPYEALPTTHITFPKIPSEEVPLAYLVHRANGSGYTGVATTDIIDIRNIIYYDPQNDDDYLRYTFTGLDDCENDLLSSTPKDKINKAITAVVNEVTNTQPLPFKTYWKQKNFQFSESFRKAYWEVKGEELSFNNAILNQTGIASHTAQLSCAPQCYEISVNTNNSCGNGTVTVELYMMLPTKTQLLHPIATNSAVVRVVDNDFNSRNGLAIHDKANKKVYFGIPTTAGAGTYTLYHFFPPTHPQLGPWWDVYPTEKVRVYIPSGSPANTVIPIGSAGSLYLGLGGATIANANANAFFSVRNR
jgi:hypothetical protein